jgi:alanyl-tRNA synthetase
MNSNEIVNAFLNSFDKSWEKREPLGLLSKYFPNTFNPSGGHDLVVPVMLSEDPKPKIKFYRVERCFRDIDVGIVGLSHHLSFFEMCTFGIVGFLRNDFSAFEEIVTHIKYFLKTLGLNNDKIFIAYFNGGRIGSIEIPPVSEEELSIWRKNFKLNLVPIPGRRTFIYSAIENWPAGAGFEIFYDRGDQFPDPIRFIEIASINFYKYINRKGKLEEVSNWALGGGIGLERIAMVLQNSPTIYDIDLFAPLNQSICRYIKKEEIQMFRKSYNIFIDHFRSASFILMDGQSIDDRTPRGKIFRKLIKRIINTLFYLNLYDKSLIDVLYKSLIKVYEKRYPDLKNKEGSILGNLKELIFTKYEFEELGET